MSMRRAASYAATITPPADPSEYSAIRVSFAQNQQIILEKDKSELTINGSDVIVQLTQAETNLFQPSMPSPMGTRQAGPAYLQIRCYKAPYEAPASAIWPVQVYDSIDTEVLS